MPLPPFLLAQGTQRDLIATALLFIAVSVARYALLRVVRHTDWASQELHLRSAAYVKRTAVLVLLLGLVAIWATELRTLAISVVAFAAALVLALKELILCISGAILRASARSFSIGDRIEVAGIRGDVIDHGLLATTVLEIGPGHQHTGRAVSLPNSVFMSTSVTNETFTRAFVLHMITVPLQPGEHWEVAQATLLGAARDICGPHVEAARRHMSELEREHAMPALTTSDRGASPADPRVFLRIADGGAVQLLLRIPAPAREKGRIEQQILRRYLAHRAASPPGSELMEKKG